MQISDSCAVSTHLPGSGSGQPQARQRHVSVSLFVPPHSYIDVLGHSPPSALNNLFSSLLHNGRREISSAKTVIPLVQSQV